MSDDKKVLFLSHAAMDAEIAARLKEVLSESFVGIEVFVSSDPESLPPASPWVETVLKNLDNAVLVLILATERGLSRKWVWFEAGAGWRQTNFIATCCLGKVRKSSLPAPYILYQAMNIDEEKGLEDLWILLEGTFEKSSEAVDRGQLKEELSRLDVRAEERDKIARGQGHFAPEVEQRARENWEKLDRPQREAIHQLFIVGELTERQVMQILRSQPNLITDGRTKVFEPIRNESMFVERVWGFDDSEAQMGYRGPYRLNPQFREQLEILVIQERTHK